MKHCLLFFLCAVLLAGCTPNQQAQVSSGLSVAVQQPDEAARQTVDAFLNAFCQKDWEQAQTYLAANLQNQLLPKDSTDFENHAWQYQIKRMETTQAYFQKGALFIGEQDTTVYQVSLFPHNETFYLHQYYTLQYQPEGWKIQSIISQRMPLLPVKSGDNDPVRLVTTYLQAMQADDFLSYLGCLSPRMQKNAQYQQRITFGVQKMGISSVEIYAPATEYFIKLFGQGRGESLSDMPMWPEENILGIQAHVTMETGSPGTTEPLPQGEQSIWFMLVRKQTGSPWVIEQLQY